MKTAPCRISIWGRGARPSVPEPGRLVLVVGPSGVGKDSILDAARLRLKDRRDVVFVQRVITRPADSGGEDHRAVSEADFQLMKQAGDFALHWSAHGLSYGLPRGLEDDLAAGRTVIANVSRAILDEARRHYGRVGIRVILARPDTLRRRLVARGRETAADIEERLRRAAAFQVHGPDVTEIWNDGALDDAVAAFVASLDLTPPARPVCG